MSSFQALKRSIIGLQSSRWAWVLSTLATIGLTLRGRRPWFVYRDTDGDWVSRQADATFFSPSYMGRSSLSLAQESADIWAFHHPVRPGETLIDIGAGGGEAVLWLSRQVGPGGQILAVEANPQTFRCLLKTIAANGLENILPLNMAISDMDAPIFIETSRVGHLSNRTSQSAGVEVQGITLDTLLAEQKITRADCIKMNIEGAETAALTGATKTLGTTGRWVISCHDFIAHRPGNEAAATWSDVRSRLAHAGLALAEPRSDTRPWIPYYCYAWLNQ